MKKNLTILLILCILLLTSCSYKTGAYNKDKGIIDNDDIYEDEAINSVKELYITVMPSEDQSHEYKYTFEELNENIDEKLEVRVLLQEGKDGVIRPGDFGYGLTDANGKMRLRGQSAKTAEQKSYRVKLDKEAGLWDSYRVVNLNKHAFDYTRTRNKLTFDYLQDIPAINSLRNQFVHVYIKDLSKGNFNEKFKDYGLFTNIENVDTTFLKNHKLDTKASLYKVENFEFYRYKESIKLKTDPEYDIEEFEKILEIKGNDDHQKLINMLEDVNNESIHINDVISKYFDRENYITWMALNILTDNIDIGSRNFYLYSPSNENKWYFLPWDYDKGWGGYHYSRGKWQEGASIYWGGVLHKRFLKNKENVKELSEKIEYLSKNIITEERTNELLAQYRPILNYYLSREPDSLDKSISLEKLEKELQEMPKSIEKNKETYYKSLEKPMPVFMDEPLKIGGQYVFKWTKSYDLQGDLIEYNIDISDSPEFETIIYHKDGIVDTEQIVNGLDLGKYYWRLQIKDSNGNIQDAFDIYRNEKTLKYYFSIQPFYVH
ncbi:inner spore coat protein H [Gottschalkia acidurici 9a]|uniref:Inner spore coat protein H n=1 Tax=Gottschalkia acidurici (strain ATCC 7906 / DSM 604 / BCRC 14475 / CIP 104303 / KCTC 5404 / NCIMB 10678 / 9a) TaxID=1128398 RepID=K0B212_GOTA9|nr:CotH kinase family protein [Gottschalkia acidurici]AFS79509.1 inner spore coat protein H [Gottschalkia acidurici 9a]